MSMYRYRVCGYVYVQITARRAYTTIRANSYDRTRVFDVLPIYTLTTLRAIFNKREEEKKINNGNSDENKFTRFYKKYKIHYI